MNIERLLRLTADYHSFVRDDGAEAVQQDADELDIDALDLVAAAGIPMPVQEEEPSL